MSEDEVKAAMEVMETKFAFREPPEGFTWAVDDLMPCLDHRRPVNRCTLCWPRYLKRLGVLCIAYYASKKQFNVNVLRGTNG
jgi:hypothetical protein